MKMGIENQIIYQYPVKIETEGMNSEKLWKYPTQSGVMGI